MTSQFGADLQPFDACVAAGCSNMRRDRLPIASTAEHFMAMPASLSRDRPWTVEEVRALRDNSNDGTRYELVDGELLVTPAPSSKHQIAVGLLHFALHPYCKAWQLGLAIVSPCDVDLNPDETTQPDVFVVPWEDRSRVRGPAGIDRLLLATEVVSPSSARGDRVKKRLHYQREGVSEYWVVDLDARVFERWRPGDTRPEVISDRVTWHPAGAQQPLELDLPSFFAEVHGEEG